MNIYAGCLLVNYRRPSLFCKAVFVSLKFYRSDLERHLKT
jgi:hypothetical protein